MSTTVEGSRPTSWFERPRILPSTTRRSRRARRSARSALLEVFGDPLFEGRTCWRQTFANARGLRDDRRGCGAAVSGHRGSRESVQTLAAHLAEEEGSDRIHLSRFPSEEVSELLSRHSTTFRRSSRRRSPGARRAARQRFRCLQGLAGYLPAHDEGGSADRADQ